MAKKPCICRNRGYETLKYALFYGCGRYARLGEACSPSHSPSRNAGYSRRDYLKELCFTNGQNWGEVQNPGQLCVSNFMKCHYQECKGFAGPRIRLVQFAHIDDYSTARRDGAYQVGMTCIKLDVVLWRR
jgi:hypothetical protein